MTTNDYQTKSAAFERQAYLITRALNRAFKAGQRADPCQAHTALSPDNPHLPACKLLNAEIDQLMKMAPQETIRGFNKGSKS